MNSIRHSLPKPLATALVILFGAVIIAIVLLATVPPLRSALPYLSQHVRGIGPAAGLTLRVDGPGMEPEFKPGQIVTLLPLSNDRPKQCDVVAYHPSFAPDKTYFHRVVAVGGDKLSMILTSISSGILVNVNGKDPCPSVLHGKTIPQSSNPPSTVILTSKQVFVVGDNLQGSIDSRAFGPILRSNIVGYLPG